jgi:NitT/TauT family transport system ATP-binding protein
VTESIEGTGPLGGADPRSGRGGGAMTESIEGTGPLGGADPRSGRGGGAKTEPALDIRGLRKVYGGRKSPVTAIENLNLTVARGEFVCLVGASGCGKSTLLHMLAGLESVTEGTLTLPIGRPALMFQESALFPWLSVTKNLDLPLRLAGLDAPARKTRIAELLALVKLEAFADAQPHQLSGGMRQRVALVRALAQGAKLLLLDEPFAALDAMSRDRLHEELERIWHDEGLTILFVTHNAREAVRLADRVVMLAPRPGRILSEHHIDLPRPRRIESPEVATRAANLLDLLKAAHAVD